MDGISLERLGNLHLVLLHLPIGFVAAAGLLELHRWRRPSAEADCLQLRLLAVNAGAALLTAGAGLALATTGKYPAETLEWHRWAGLVCAGLAAVAWSAQARGRPWLARAALAALFAGTVVAGHLGATLTHGEDATALWGGKTSRPTRASAKAGVKTTDGAHSFLFTNEIQPILERSCIDCHGPAKIKGRLRLDNRDAAIAGGRSGRAAIVPGRPEESELIRRVRLPRDDDDAMPSGDEPGLSAAEIAALEKWIADGAVWH
jgi:mono/diheme cytochrome c family protein